MTRGMTQLPHLLRALFAPGRGDTLSASDEPPMRGRRMVRRAVVYLLVGAAPILAGIGAYSVLNPPATPDAVAPPPPPPPPSENGLPTAEEFDRLAATDPVRMLQAGLTRYRQQVPVGFEATLEKQEVVQGKEFPPEVIRLAVRDRFPDNPESPPSPQVRMIWLSGLRKGGIGAFKFDIRGTLLADGKTITVWRPSALKAEHSVAANDDATRAESRYCMRDAGIYSGMHRTYRAWERRQKAGELTAEYVGKQPVEKAGGRVCHVVRRTCVHPEADAFELGGEPPTDPAVIARDGFNEVTISIDAETWLQVGTRIERVDGPSRRLVGEYYFRDVNLNPSFDDATFTFAGMKAAAPKK